jgi:hypothetical protein
MMNKTKKIKVRMARQKVVMRNMKSKRKMRMMQKIKRNMKRIMRILVIMMINKNQSKSLMSRLRNKNRLPTVMIKKEDILNWLMQKNPQLQRMKRNNSRAFPSKRKILNLKTLKMIGQ